MVFFHLLTVGVDIVSRGVLPEIGLPVMWSHPYADSYVSLSTTSTTWSMRSFQSFHISSLPVSCLCGIWSTLGSCYVLQPCNAHVSRFPSVKITCFVHLEERHSVHTCIHTHTHTIDRNRHSCTYIQIVCIHM